MCKLRQEQRKGPSCQLTQERFINLHPSQLSYYLDMVDSASRILMIFPLDFLVLEGRPPDALQHVYLLEDTTWVTALTDQQEDRCPGFRQGKKKCISKKKLQGAQEVEVRSVLLAIAFSVLEPGTGTRRKKEGREQPCSRAQGPAQIKPSLGLLGNMLLQESQTLIIMGRSSSQGECRCLAG